MIILKDNRKYTDKLIMNFFVNPLDKDKNNKSNTLIPTYVKPDGTKVFEKKEELGHSVYEVSPDGTVIMRGYNSGGVMICDYVRSRNLEIGHQYDNSGKMFYEYNNLYDENNNLAKKYEKNYTYHDNGKKSSETTNVIPGDVKTVIKYDINEERIEKTEQRGAVKTWFDINDKPIKRQIDRCSRGIITEDLTDK